MAIKIVPHAEDKRDLVEVFNRRMREAGSPWGFYVDPVPQWIPKRADNQPAWRELYLALEDDANVVGGFALKPQEWLVRGRRYTITDWQGPFSLGAVDKRYAALGLRMIRDMVKRQPLLYSWGHGGNEEPMVQMLKKLGWLMHETPFLLRVVRPFNFLRKNGYLRRYPGAAAVSDVLAWTGAGPALLHGLHIAMRVRSTKRFASSAEVVSTFGPWADEVWDRSKGRYDAIAVRDSSSLNTVVPRDHATEEWPPPTRLRIKERGQLIGWAVVLEKRLSRDVRFGDMRVGMIADYFGLPEDAGAIVHAAFDHLRDSGVDIVIANQAHPAWVTGFIDSGFVTIEGRRLFCASPELEKILEPFEQTRRGLFISNMDGHGPIL